MQPKFTPIKFTHDYIATERDKERIEELRQEYYSEKTYSYGNEHSTYYNDRDGKA